MKSRRKRIKEAQKEAELAIKATNEKINELGASAIELDTVLNTVQEHFNKIRNVPAEQQERYKEAEAIRLKGEAEAIGIEKKAEAQKKMGEASIVEMLMEALPKMTEAAAAPLTNVDKIIQYGDGNSTKMISDVMGVTTKIFEALEQSGIDIKSLLNGFVGAKIATKE